jgi:hypothetical protein
MYVHIAWFTETLRFDALVKGLTPMFACIKYPNRRLSNKSSIFPVALFTVCGDSQLSSCIFSLFSRMYVPTPRLDTGVQITLAFSDFSTICSDKSGSARQRRRRRKSGFLFLQKSKSAFCRDTFLPKKMTQRMVFC